MSVDVPTAESVGGMLGSSSEGMGSSISAPLSNSSAHYSKMAALARGEKIAAALARAEKMAAIARGEKIKGVSER